MNGGGAGLKEQNKVKASGGFISLTASLSTLDVVLRIALLIQQKSILINISH